MHVGCHISGPEIEWMGYIYGIGVKIKTSLNTPTRYGSGRFNLSPYNDPYFDVFLVLILGEVRFPRVRSAPRG